LCNLSSNFTLITVLYDVTWRCWCRNHWSEWRRTGGHFNHSLIRRNVTLLV